MNYLEEHTHTKQNKMVKYNAPAYFSEYWLYRQIIPAPVEYSTCTELIAMNSVHKHYVLFHEKTTTTDKCFWENIFSNFSHYY